MKPNLLNFANNILLSNGKHGAYNTHTGEQSPDIGFMVPLVTAQRSALDEDIIRSFYLEHADLLAEDHAWLFVYWDGYNWILTVSQLVFEIAQAITKAASRGVKFVWNNAIGEDIQLELSAGQTPETLAVATLNDLIRGGFQ